MAEKNVTEASVQPGPGTDAKGQAVRDPSDNVMDLVHAANERQNDLRNVDLAHLRDLLEYNERLRTADAKFYDERDRRLTEVAAEREKALKIKDEGTKEAARIKEEADKEARELAREAQRYRDDQANKLRDQIATDRGDLVTLAQFQPIADFVTAQQTRNEGALTAKADDRSNRSQSSVNINMVIALAVLLLGVLVYVRG